MPAPLRVVEHVDPRTLIQTQVGEHLRDIHPVGTGILIVLYERGAGQDEVKVGSIIVPKTKSGALAEDKFQGKVGLVAKCGPAAFEEDANHKWGSQLPGVGDWVLFRHSDPFLFDLPGDRRAGIIQDVQILAVLDKPDIVW